VNAISFSIIVTVGNDEVDNILKDYLLIDFSNWYADLKENKLSNKDKEWILERGKSNLMNFEARLGRGLVNKDALQQTNPLVPTDVTLDVAPIVEQEDNFLKRYKIEIKDGEIDVSEPSDYIFKVDKSREWDLNYLFDHHPEGTDTDFYKGILWAIRRLGSANNT
jgi:hypothetical protein